MRYFLEHGEGLEQDSIWLLDETTGMVTTMWLEEGDNPIIREHADLYKNLDHWFTAPILDLRDARGVTFYRGLSQGNIEEITFEQLLEL